MTKFLEWSRRLQYHADTSIGVEFLSNDPEVQLSSLGTEVSVTAP